MSECRLWKYVICQAISDSYLGNTKEKLSVSKWILSQDFSDVCDLAELNADRLFKMINFEKQFDNIESKFKDIENNLNNQINLDTEKLIKLNNLKPILDF